MTHVVVHAFNSRNKGVKAEDLYEFENREFQTRQGHIMRLCVNKINKRHLLLYSLNNLAFMNLTLLTNYTVILTFSEKLLIFERKLLIFYVHI